MPLEFRVMQDDFDRIALLPEPKWELDELYLGKLLGYLPNCCDRILEIGCGTGRITRRLAKRARSIVALDASAVMIATAQERANSPNTRYEQADFMSWSSDDGPFHAVITVATLHHLPLRAALARMREFVSPGGLILALDFFDPTGHEGFLEKLTESALSRARRFLHTGRWLPPPEVQEAWRQHGQHDEKPTWVEAKATIFTELSGALRGRVRG